MPAMRGARPPVSAGDTAYGGGGDAAADKIRGPQRLSRPSLLQLFSGLGEVARGGRAAASQPSNSGPAQLEKQSLPSGSAGEALPATQVIQDTRLSQGSVCRCMVKQIIAWHAGMQVRRRKVLLRMGWQRRGRTVPAASPCLSARQALARRVMVTGGPSSGGLLSNGHDGSCLHALEKHCVASRDDLFLSCWVVMQSPAPLTLP